MLGRDRFLACDPFHSPRRCPGPSVEELRLDRAVQDPKRNAVLPSGRGVAPLNDSPESLLGDDWRPERRCVPKQGPRRGKSTVGGMLYRPGQGLDSQTLRRYRVYLIRLLDHDVLEAMNNLAEREVRPAVIA